MKKYWMMGLAAASMAVLLAGCGGRDDTTSGGGMTSGTEMSTTSSTAGYESSTPATGDNMPGPSGFPDGDGNTNPSGGILGGDGTTAGTMD